MIRPACHLPLTKCDFYAKIYDPLSVLIFQKFHHFPADKPQGGNQLIKQRLALIGAAVFFLSLAFTATAFRAQAHQLEPVEYKIYKSTTTSEYIAYVIRTRRETERDSFGETTYVDNRYEEYYFSWDGLTFYPARKEAMDSDLKRAILDVRIPATGKESEWLFLRENDTVLSEGCTFVRVNLQVPRIRLMAFPTGPVIRKVLRNATATFFVIIADDGVNAGYNNIRVFAGPAGRLPQLAIRRQQSSRLITFSFECLAQGTT